MIEMVFYETIEIVATSENSFSDAVRAGFAEAKKTVRHIRNIEIVRSDVKVKEDTGALIFRVRMKMSFELERK